MPHCLGPRFRAAQPEKDMITIALLAITWITDAGGAIARDNAGRITGVDLRSSWATDADIGDLAGIPDLKTVDLSLSRISDRGLRSLRTAPGIVDLNLYFAE